MTELDGFTIMDEPAAAVEEEAPFEIRVGTPSAMFIPAGPYKFKSNTKLYRVVVPRKGKFPEDAPAFANEEFDIVPSSGEILFGDLLKVMSVMNCYPRLKKNETFIIFSIEVKADMVAVVGETVAFLEGLDVQ